MSNNKHTRVRVLATPRYALARSLRRSARLERSECALDLFGAEVGL